MISANSLKIWVHFNKNKTEDSYVKVHKIVDKVIPILDVATFCTILWGTISVFGKYNFLKISSKIFQYFSIKIENYICYSLINFLPYLICQFRRKN